MGAGRTMTCAGAGRPIKHIAAAPKTTPLSWQVFMMALLFLSVGYAAPGRTGSRESAANCRRAFTKQRFPAIMAPSGEAARG